MNLMLGTHQTYETEECAPSRVILHIFHSLVGFVYLVAVSSLGLLMTPSRLKLQKHCVFSYCSVTRQP